MIGNKVGPARGISTDVELPVATMRFEIYEDPFARNHTPWQERLRSGKYDVLAASTVGFPDEQTYQRAINSLKNVTPAVQVETEPHPVDMLASRG